MLFPTTSPPWLTQHFCSSPNDSLSPYPIGQILALRMTRADRLNIVYSIVIMFLYTVLRQLLSQPSQFGIQQIAFSH